MEEALCSTGEGCHPEGKLLELSVFPVVSQKSHMPSESRSVHLFLHS